MSKIRNNITILMAEDDPDDRLLATDAINSVGPIKKLEFVEDGEELINYLLRFDKYTTRVETYPSLIILDLNMPKKDGREALQELKKHSHLKKIPIIVLTTSVNEEDIVHVYDLGVNSYITKPASFTEFINMMKTIIEYWTEIVELPTQS